MYVRSKYDFNNINKTNDTVLLRREREDNGKFGSQHNMRWKNSLTL